jgi:hypothetical protein
MKFYKLGEIPIRGDDQVFKVSPPGKGISFILFSAIAIAALGLGIGGGKQFGLDLPLAFYYVVAAAFGLLGWIAFTAFRASLKPTNWLLRCNSSGVIIKYRSYLNWRLPATSAQAVGFDYAEIAWARTVKERRTSPGMGRHNAPESVHLTFLDLGLFNADTSALEAHLRAERNLKPDGMVISLDYPVQVLPGGTVEIRWSGGIKPVVAQAIKYLSQHVNIVAADSRKVDLTHSRNAPPAEELAKIVELVNSGDEFGAVKLTQQIYGYSLSEAEDFVEKLQGGDAAGADR